VDKAHVNGTHYDTFVVTTELGPCFFEESYPDDGFSTFGSSATKSWKTLSSDGDVVIDDNLLPGSVDTEV
jgi:hypothetical protein